ncbi:MAG: ribokinase [Trueperella sp.]|nr:ribokinase [Trueperella sp.]
MHLPPPDIQKIASQVLAALSGRTCMVGSINADLTVETAQLPGPGQTVTGGPLQILPGGKSANQAVTASKLGAPTDFIGAIGTDPYAAMLEKSLQDAGVNTQFLLHRDGPSGTAIITVDNAGENSIVISPGANGMLTPADIELAHSAIAKAETLGLCLEVATETVIRAAQIARAADTLVVFNFSPIKPVPPELISLIDVLIVNEHELATLADFPPEKVTAARTDTVTTALKEIGVPQAVVTLGAAGSLIYDDAELHHILPFPVATVDTTGAGDSFMGTLLAALATDFSLRDGAVLASCVSALSTTKLGAQNSYPTRSEVQEYLIGLR